MLTADSRVTVRRPALPDIAVDECQKIFSVTSGTAIGFVAEDVNLAGRLLRFVFSNLRHRRRVDPISLGLWLPRVFRTAYRKLVGSATGPQTAFMVASVVPGYPNIISRQAVVDLMNRIASGKSPIQRNWLPQILVDLVKTPPRYTHIAITGTARGLLYVMQSPHFNVVGYPPLKYVAIGSGHGAFKQIEDHHDIILAGDVGNSPTEAHMLRDAVWSFITQSAVQDVGGLFPVLKVSERGTEHLGFSVEIPVGGTQIELLADTQGVWTQRNVTTGKTIPLRLPWDVDWRAVTDDHRFDDLADLEPRS